MRLGFIIAFVSLIVMSCTTVPMTSIPRLKRIDFATTDISKAMIVLRSDEAMKFDSSRILFTFYIRETGVDDPQNHEYKTYLRENNQDAEAEALKRANTRDGSRLVSLSFTPEAVAVANEYREISTQMQAEGRHGEGGFFTDVDDFCLDKNAANDSVRGDVWIRTEETERFVLMMRNVDLTGKSYNEVSDEDRAGLYCD